MSTEPTATFQSDTPPHDKNQKPEEVSSSCVVHVRTNTDAPASTSTSTEEAVVVASSPSPVTRCRVLRADLDKAVEAGAVSDLWSGPLLLPLPHRNVPRCAVCGNIVARHGLHKPAGSHSVKSKPQSTMAPLNSQAPGIHPQGAHAAPSRGQMHDPAVENDAANTARSRVTVNNSPDDADHPHVVRIRHAPQLGLSLWEHLSNGVSWVMCISIWLHLWVIIPLVETGTVTFMDGYRPWYWIPTGVIYVLYLIQSAFAPTRQYLNSILQQNVDAYVEHLRETAPELWYSVQNYHYETRTETYTDSKGNRQTRERQVRVDTHFAKGAYAYDEWRDTSAAMEIPANAAMSRLRLEKEHVFADDYTRDHYDRQFQNFVAMNSTDAYQDVDSGLEIDQFKKYVLAPRDPANVSKFFSLWVYVPMTVFTFSPLYRVLFFIRTHPVDWTVEKTIKTRAFGS